jgi:hypothetical protein
MRTLRQEGAAGELDARVFRRFGHYPGEDEAGEIYVANSLNDLPNQGLRRPADRPSGRCESGELRPGIVAGSLATVFVAGVSTIWRCIRGDLL